jgi:tetratricopeptide (TPR) repeat protein
MRIFISYGRGDAANVAIKLAHWLRTQGHEPWLDVENGIPIGSAYDIRIETGMAESELLIALLSPWSLRPDGFCRNEILYAQAMGIPIIPVRLADVIPPIQIISLNFIDARNDLEAVYEILPSLITEVANTRQMPLRQWEFLRARQPWWAACQPLDFHEELARHGGSFVGREWLFEEIRNWIASSNSRIMIITADAGVGKSAIAAQMTTRLNVRGVHFCTRSNIESCRPKAWLAGLVYQLAAQFTAYRNHIEGLEAPNWGDPAESLFRTLITDPLRACQTELALGEPWVFVIDGLDESLAAAGECLRDLLSDSAERIPNWIRFLVTSRPDQSVIAAFNVPSVFILNLDAKDERNRSDLIAYIAGYIEQITAKRIIPDRPEIVSNLAHVTAGNFLFAKMTLDALRSPDPKLRLTLDEIGALPSNLGGLYHKMFSRRFRDSTRYEHEMLPLLDCLVAAREPVPEGILVKAAGPDEHAARQGLRVLSQFLVRSDDTLRVFHQSLADWLIASDRSAEFAASLESGHRRLADVCWNEYQSSPGKMSRYSVTHLPTHLAEASRWQDLFELVNRSEFGLFTRWIEGGEGDTGLACLIGLINFLEKEHKQPVTSAGLATQLARIYGIRGRYDEAEEWLQHAINQTSWLLGRRVRAIALHEMGSLHLYRSRWHQAARCYRQALRLCRLGWPVYHDEAAANLVGLATIFQTRYGFRKTIDFAVQAIREAVRAGDSHHIIAGERLLGAACKVLGRYAEAESHIQSAIKLSRACGTHLETARLLLLFGYLIYDLATLTEEIPTKARDSFQTALIEAEGHHHLYCILEAKIALGWCALATGATEEAMHWLEPLNKSAVARIHGDLLSGLELGLAGIAYQQGDFSSARGLYKNVLSSCTEQDDRSSCSKAYIGLGAIEWHLGQHEQAQAAWRQSLQLASRVSEARQRLAEHSINMCQRHHLVVPR